MADALAPTGDEIFDESKLPWSKLGYADGTELQPVVTEAAVYVEQVTGRYFTDMTPPVYPTGEASVSLGDTPDLYVLARQAVRMRAEQVGKQAQPDYIDTVTDDAIQSFTAGPYSESRVDPTRRGETKALNPWKQLSDLLWLLMTGDRYDYWIAFLSGQHVPAFENEEVEWGLIGKDSLYGAFDPYAPWTMWY